LFASIDAIESLESMAEKVQLGLHSREFIRGVSKDSYHKRKALGTIRDSFEVLKDLGIFKK
jgi:hypothetical protein